MNVASLEHCKELYELSGWGLMSNGTSTDWYWTKEYSLNKGFDFQLRYWNEVANQVAHFNIKVEKGNAVSAYDLGYLLRKLPASVSDGWFGMWKSAKGKFSCGYITDGLDIVEGLFESENTPEDALCKLAIELFEQGVLTRGGDA